MTTKRSIDPSHTALLRRKCVAEMKRKCKLLMKDVQNLFSERNQLISNIDQDEFRFATSTNKVKMFRQWLKEQVDKNILAVVGGPRSKVWLASYVEAAWKKGLLRSYSTVHRAATTGVNWFGGAQTQFVKDVLNNPNVVSQLELLFTRSFNLLEGVTNEMSNQMSMILADGLANRWSVTRIANEMSRKITSLTNKRALLIAQTEIVRAQAEGQLDGMKLLGISEVEAEVELITYGDVSVCPTCRDLKGNRYTIAEARGIIPLHPACRCAWSPITPAFSKKARR